MKIHMKRYGDNGWKFWIDFEPYRTNPNGDGLWHFQPTGAWSDDHGQEYEYKQVLGTCQFSLSSKRPAAYAKIRRYFSKLDSDF